MSVPPASLPKIAFVLEYSLFYGGGVSVLVRELINALGAEYALILVSPDSTEDIARSPLMALLHAHISWSPTPLTRARGRELAARLADQGVNIAHFHGGGNFAWGNRRPWTAPFAALRARGVKCVFTSHLVVSAGHSLWGPTAGWLERWAKLIIGWAGKMRALMSLECEIAVSDHDLHLLRRWYFPFRKKFTRIYHSRIHATLPPSSGVREKLILTVGHRAWRKGQLHLVRAFAAIAAAIPGWRLNLIGAAGEPEYERKIADFIRAKRLEERVQLLGDRSDALEQMQTAAIYVQPSLQEALGLALQEALFAGCACIGSRIGGIPELIDHEKNGLLFPPGNESALTSHLERLINGADERQRYAAAGRESMRQRGMTSEAMVSNHRSLYTKLLSKSLTPPQHE